jgi:hypothetical protein
LLDCHPFNPDSTSQTNKEWICNCSLFAKTCKNFLNHKNASFSVNIQKKPPNELRKKAWIIKIFQSHNSTIQLRRLCLILAASFISRFCSCHMEFRKSALPAGETVFMFSHKNTFPTPRTISFGASNFVLSFCFVKREYLDFSFFRITYFFICHYLLFLTPSTLNFSSGCLFSLQFCRLLFVNNFFPILF